MKVEGEDEIAQCTKCNTVQFIAEAKYLLAANFTVKTTSEEMINVRAYGTILLNICETKDCTEITSTSLLRAKLFTIDGTVHSIKREKVTPFSINKNELTILNFTYLQRTFI